MDSFELLGKAAYKNDDGLLNQFEAARDEQMEYDYYMSEEENDDT